MKTYIAAALPAILSLLVFAPPATLAGDVTCDDITWRPDVIKRFPDVVTGCREVIVQDKHLFARFEAKMVRARVTTGEVKIKILLPNGGQVERTFNAPKNFRVKTPKGNRKLIFELERGELIDILISDNSFSLASVDENGRISLAPPLS